MEARLRSSEREQNQSSGYNTRSRTNHVQDNSVNVDDIDGVQSNDIQWSEMHVGSQSEALPMDDSKKKYNKTGAVGLAGDRSSIALLILLYILQGIPLGIAGCIPYLLSSRHVSYKDQAIFSFVHWPFSIKLLWAPIVDSVFFPAFGRRKSWMVPTQYLIGLFMFLLSQTGSVASLMDPMTAGSVDVTLLTAMFFSLNFLAATQDIAVDGWALTMLSQRNVGWVATCNTVGQTIGYFAGNVVFLTLESAEFCNKYLRFEPQAKGIVNLAGYLQFWSLVFVVVTTLVMILKHEKGSSFILKSSPMKEAHENSMSKGDGADVSLHALDEESQSVLSAYKQLWRVVRLPSVLSLIVTLLTIKIGFAAADSITSLKLIEEGVPKEHLALLAIPMVAIDVVLPVFITRSTSRHRPLDVVLAAMPLRLGLGLFFAGIVWWVPGTKMSSGEYPIHMYGVLLLSSALHQVAVYFMFVPLMAFFAKVSDPTIGGTYMTLLNTVCNFGGNWPATVALALVDFLTWKGCVGADSVCTAAVQLCDLLPSEPVCLLPVVSETESSVTNVINVFGDGRCLFRCLVAHMFPSLQTTAREVNGVIKQNNLAKEETRLSDLFRAAVCKLLTENADMLSSFSTRLPLLLDSSVGRKYSSSKTRIKNMARPTTFAGNVEMLASAFLLRRQIHIYVPSDCGPRLLAKLPCNVFASYPPVNLLHNEDNKNNCGHFDLLVFTPITPEITLSNFAPGKSIDEMLTYCVSNCSEIDKQYALDDIINDHSGESERNEASAVCDNMVDESGSPDQPAYERVNSTLNEESDGDNNIDTQLDKCNAEENPVTESTNEYPSLWNEEQAVYFSNQYPWLTYCNGLLGCNDCRQVKCLGVLKQTGVKLSQEWISNSVTYNGNTRQNQLSSLRKKMYEHENGAAHRASTDILTKASTNSLEKIVATQKKHLFDSTERVFRTVYSCVKNNRPFTDVPKLIDLQQTNGLDMGLILHSDHTAAAICDLIGKEMKTKLCGSIIRSKAHIAVIIDESTTSETKSVLILYIRALAFEKVTTFFLDLIELEKSDAASIVTALTLCLTSHGFTHDYLVKYFIAICSDGASVMVGSKSGVLTAFAKIYPRIVRWHCLCHRIELSVADTIEDIGGINHFKSFMEKLYSVYSQSPKNQRQLADCAAEMDVQLKKIGKMLSIRWVSSSFRAVSAVHSMYGSLYRHFIGASSDTSRDSKTRQTFVGLSKTLASEEFVLNLGLMLDSLDELTHISEALQRDDITIQRAYQIINRTVRALENMKTTKSQYTQESIVAVESGIYQTVPLDKTSNSRVRKQPAIDRLRFLQSLADNLRSRLYTTIASNRASLTFGTDRDTNLSDFEELINQIRLLDPHSWPVIVPSPWIEGETNLHRLCDKLNVPWKISQEGFGDFIDKGGDTVPVGLKLLQTAIDTIPVTSADAERGFSTINIICNAIRSSLAVPRLSNLIFISLVGPKLQDFCAKTFVDKWLVTGHRPSCDNQSKKCKPSSDDDRYKHLSAVFK